MVRFESEQDLLAKVSQHDELVRQCVRGELSFDEFCERYNDFYASYALDGHESDDEERALLLQHEHRLEPHRLIAEDILCRVCSDADAVLDSYQSARRFGSAEATRRLADVAFASDS